MTTPDTTAVRAWARENGYDVAGRGRLPAEVVEAYSAAQRGGAAKEVGRAAAKGALTKRPARKAPAAKASAAKAAAKAPAKAAAKAPAKAPAAEVDQAPAKKAGRAAAKGATAPKGAAATKAATAPKGAPAAEAKAPAAAAPQEPARKAADRPDPSPKPSRVTDDRRLVALGEQLRALTERVDALEKALGSDKGGKGTKPRFRRR